MRARTSRHSVFGRSTLPGALGLANRWVVASTHAAFARLWRVRTGRVPRGTRPCGVRPRCGSETSTREGRHCPLPHNGHRASVRRTISYSEAALARIAGILYRFGPLRVCCIDLQRFSASKSIQHTRKARKTIQHTRKQADMSGQRGGQEATPGPAPRIPATPPTTPPETSRTPRDSNKPHRRDPDKRYTPENEKPKTPLPLQTTPPAHTRTPPHIPAKTRGNRLMPHDPLHVKMGRATIV
jgi:hypothetical protein